MYVHQADSISMQLTTSSIAARKRLLSKSGYIKVCERDSIRESELLSSHCVIAEATLASCGEVLEPVREA